MKRYVLAIDQGTTSSKALVIDEGGAVVARSRNFPVTASYPRAGWVEFDPARMLDSIRAAAKDAVSQAGIDAGEIAAVGLANQGETVIAFDSRTGEPVCPAISWQDRRCMDIIERWRGEGLEDEVRRRTGLRLDPYFSAGKMRWVLENVPVAKELASTGRLRLGTSDSWILWKLSGGARFVTDVSTASRTMLLDLASMNWDSDLLHAAGIPGEALPGIAGNCETVNWISLNIFRKLTPAVGLCVDQQAALFGQRCLARGQAKATYGTGCFVLANIGEESEARREGLLTSVGWSIGGSTTYVFDGGIYSAGSVLGWLRNELGLYADHAELERLAGSVEDTDGVYLFPAFAGLASPHWKPNAKAAYVGLTLGTRREHVLRAALEAIAFRVKDIADAMDGPEIGIESLQVDGGLTNSDLLMQIQADLLGAPLYRGMHHEATAVGVAMMAGIGAGVWKSVDDLPEARGRSKVFEPGSGEARETLLERYRRWREISMELIEWEKHGRA